MINVGQAHAAATLDSVQLTPKSVWTIGVELLGKRMLKRILLMLGETPSSVTARAYAFRVARETNADLAGLAGVDLTLYRGADAGRRRDDRLQDRAGAVA